MDQSTVALIASLGSVIITGLGIYKAIKLAPREIKQADVDLVVKYAAATGTAIEQLKESLDKMDEYVEKLAYYRETVDELYDGIKVLSDQLKDNKIVPAWNREKIKPFNK